MRNRRYVGRKGPLVVFGDEFEIAKAFRNLPGVETASVNSLNLLQVILPPFQCKWLLVRSCGPCRGALPHPVRV